MTKKLKIGVNAINVKFLYPLLSLISKLKGASLSEDHLIIRMKKDSDLYNNRFRHSLHKTQLCALVPKMRIGVLVHKMPFYILVCKNKFCSLARKPRFYVRKLSFYTSKRKLQSILHISVKNAILCKQKHNSLNTNSSKIFYVY